MARVGLIAGIGILPVEFMRAAHLQGHEVVVVSVVKDSHPALQAEGDAYYNISPLKLGKIFKTLHSEGVKELTLLGKVTKEILYKKGLTFPDMKAVKILNQLRNRKDDTLMLAIIDALEAEGFQVVDQTLYLQPFMPEVGILTKREPTEEQWKDIHFGFSLAKEMGRLDIGQTVVVKHQAAMAIEAIEGTDKCILRGGQLGQGGAVVVKTAKPGQDLRFDVPAVGRTTLQSMIDSECSVLAVEAKKTVFVEQESVLQMANEKGIVIVSLAEE